MNPKIDPFKCFEDRKVQSAMECRQLGLLAETFKVKSLLL